MPGGQASAAAVDECPASVEDATHVADLEDGEDAVACGLIGEELSIGVGNLKIEVPEPGHVVSMEVMGAGPSASEQVVVGVLPDGALDLDIDPRAAAAGAPSECNDSAYVDWAPMRDNESFRINKGSVPTNVNTANAVEAIEDGMRAWPQLYNACGEPDNVTVTVAYGGDTNAGTSTTSGTTSGCNAASSYHDEASVVCSRSASE